MSIHDHFFILLVNMELINAVSCDFTPPLMNDGAKVFHDVLICKNYIAEMISRTVIYCPADLRYYCSIITSNMILAPSLKLFWNSRHSDVNSAHTATLARTFSHGVTGL